MQIELSAENRKNVFTIPVVPPQISLPIQQYNYEQFDSLNGTLTLVGQPKLRVISWESFFPKRKMPWMKSGFQEPQHYLKLIEYWINAKIPIRIIVKDEQREILNMPAMITAFDYSYEALGDMRYSIELTEYIFPDVKKVK